MPKVKRKPKMDELEKVYRRNENFVHRRIEGETILVPIRSNVGDLDHLYSLNDAGAFIWNTFDGFKDIETIKSFLASEYNVSDGEAETDLLSFVQELEEIEAVICVKS
jgi:hypothetical protein